MVVYLSSTYDPGSSVVRHWLKLGVVQVLQLFSRVCFVLIKDVFTPSLLLICQGVREQESETDHTYLYFPLDRIRY